MTEAKKDIMHLINHTSFGFFNHHIDHKPLSTDPKGIDDSKHNFTQICTENGYST